MKKLSLKNRILSKIVIFTVITMVCLWLLPVGFISAEDSALPVITLNGDSTVDVVVGTAYEEAGAAASVTVVNEDLTESIMDLTGSIIIAGADAIDTTVAGGPFSVTYDVSDASSNAAVQVVRTVYVVEALDTTPPADETPELIEGSGENLIEDLVTEAANNGKIEVEKDVRDYSGNNVSDNQPFTVRLWWCDTQDGTYVEYGSKTTKESDDADWYNLPTPKWYMVTEDTDSDYVLKSITNKQQLTNDDEDVFKVVNWQKPPSNGHIRVEKDVRDYSGNNVSDNHTFTVRLWWSDTENGTYVEYGSLPIKESDDADWTSLPTERWYMVTEDTDSGYVLKSITGKQRLNAGDNDAFNVVNWQVGIGSIKINKTVTGGLTGTFDFTLTKSGQPTKTAQITIDSGETTDFTTVSGLACGEWVVTEARGPGYICTSPDDYDWKHINVTNGGTTDANFTNAMHKCDVKIQKFVDGVIATSGTFNFTGPDGSLVLPDGGKYYKTFSLQCGKEYTITEDVPKGYELLEICSQDVEVIGKTPTSITFKLNCEFRDSNSVGAACDPVITFKNHKIPTCRVTIYKFVDGAIATTGSFGFTVEESKKPLGSAVYMPIPATFILNIGNLYTATYDVLCGVEYKITEDGPPSGFTFDSISTSSDIIDKSINGQSITFTLCSNINAGSTEIITQPVSSITFYNKTITGSNLLRLVKTSSATGLPLAGAVYSLYVGSTLIYDLLPTGADGSTLVSLPWPNTVYTVREKTPPPGYALDPTSYTVTAGSDPITITLNVQDSPLIGGGGTVTVAGLTEGIQVLAFTGIDPIIPIAGGSAIAGGLALFFASLLKRKRATVK